MNFKRYHVSKNLAWTGWAQDFVDRIDDSSKAYIIDSDMLYFTAAAGYGEQDTKFLFKIDWKENTRYTISFNYQRSSSESTSSMAQIVYTDGTTKRFPNYVNDGMWHYQTVASDRNKTIKYIGIYWSSGNLKIDINTFMVNEGTSALPYEPYGNTWINTPHYIMGTETDTITTLPTVIYPTSTTATVGLKGNTVQNGTPTPTTPIQPQGTGERTGNLFDISKVVPNVNVTNQGDSLKIATPSTTTSVVAGSPYTLQTYCPNLQVGDVATLSFVSTGSSKYIYLQGENITWVSGQSKTITSTMLSSAVLWYASGVSTEAIISNVMLNLGSTALPYEPYGYFIEIEVS